MLGVESRFRKSWGKCWFFLRPTVRNMARTANGPPSKCLDAILQEIINVYVNHFNHEKFTWDC